MLMLVPPSIQLGASRALAGQADDTVTAAESAVEGPRPYVYGQMQLVDSCLSRRHFPTACVTYPLAWVTERLHSCLDRVYRIHSCMLCDPCYCSSHHVLQIQTESRGDQRARVPADNCRGAATGSDIPIGILCWSSCCQLALAGYVGCLGFYCCLPWRAKSPCRLAQGHLLAAVCYLPRSCPVPLSAARPVASRKECPVGAFRC